ncbi:PucR family transcriptional regulator [Ornithinimicrobium pekingense]|uniref:PucR family transcriptional regulator n=1 Tax=Ornithinimicrobium pekingense TaxID=384677 RepID=A0ABQ2FC13_9MICO|nr:PucR family transcriptional regulator [Ornithinimicrobium pekingense]GGK79632.1 hypothetical protein GCM10011509_30200 [Ornithinimicrobium pekingense]
MVEHDGRDPRAPSAELPAHRLTVRDLLDLPSLRAGLPEILTGHARLDSPVRWVHVTESRSAARFLEGGEVALTTGADWPDGDELRAHIGGIVRAGATAIVLELGSRYDEAPAPAVEVCTEAGLPLIVLHREVQFVAVTEAAHRLLVASRVAELEARDRIQALFAELNRLGSSPSTVVAETARLLASPVVLEDVAHRVVCCAPHDRSEGEVLTDWATRSRTLGQDDQARVVDVAARGRRYGRLVALGVSPDLTDSVVDLVLLQATLSLSLGVMESAGARHSSWDTVRHRRLLRMLTERDFTSAGHAMAALKAAGLTVDNRVLSALAWTVVADPVSGRTVRPDDVREVASRVAGQLRMGLLCAPEPTVGGGYVGLVSVDPSTRAAEEFLDEFAARLRAGPLPLDLLAVGGTVGPGHDVDGLLVALARARELIETGRPGTRDVLRARGTEIDLLTSQVPSTSLQGFVDKMLGPVLAYDARHDSDLLLVLETYLRHPNNRTLAARESHLSRSVFYQRLELLESQLGRDLRDGAVMAALTLAVSAYRQSER